MNRTVDRSHSAPILAGAPALPTANTATVLGAIEDRSARGIAAAMSRLVTGGALDPGDRLPTVRALAAALEISPTTVSEAWQALAQLGVIESRGRAGSFVRGPSRPIGPSRYRRITEGPANLRLDLSTGLPDPDLLPEIRPMLSRISQRDLTHSYLDDPVLPQLAEVLRQRWPFGPQALTVVDGALDALDRLCSMLVRFGDRVAVENPAFAPLLDLLEQLGAEVIPLAMDRHGVVPTSMQSALRRNPSVVLLQPRAQNPSGSSMSSARARQLAEMLRDRPLVVIEDDHCGDIAAGPLVSMGSHLPAQTVLIQSFSKSHGPDLRIAAVGGAESVITPLVNRRTLGPGWTSRVLQVVLHRMLIDAGAIATVERARNTYAERRASMVEVLHRRGVRTTGDDGINLWAEAHDENMALLDLAAQGIGAAPGSPFLAAPLGADHLRITVGLVNGDHQQLADRLADALLGTTRRRSPNR